MDPFLIPPAYRDYVVQILGAHADDFLDGLRHPVRNVIRINTLKTDPTALLARLTGRGFRFQELHYPADAFQVVEEPSLISKTIEHFLGLFYLQSVASMIPPAVLTPQPSERVLDLAAAPGSKTTQIAQIMANRGVLVANEWDGKRIKTLSHNLDRMGVVNAALVNMPGERIGNLLPETFDKVLVDAPCSALGVIHKAPQAMENLRFLSRFAFVQERLLVSAIKAARIGGTVVYSTCTIAPEENELLLHRLLGRYPIELEAFEVHPAIATMPGLTSAGGESLDASLARTQRILPNAVNPEGFFVALIRKKDAMPAGPGKEPFNNKKIAYRLVDSGDGDVKKMAEYFEEVFGIDPAVWGGYRFLKKEDEILMASAEWEGHEDMLNRIYTHRVGVRVARTRRPGEWKLSTNAAQLLHQHIRKNLIHLDDLQEIETFITAGTIRRSFDITEGGVVVVGQGQVLGCGVMHQGGLKSQMPKSRTVIGVDMG